MLLLTRASAAALSLCPVTSVQQAHEAGAPGHDRSQEQHPAAQQLCPQGAQRILLHLVTADTATTHPRPPGLAAGGERTDGGVV